MRDGKRGVQLYVKRVFIMDDCEALVPEYLRFVKGVVDANDLSLNISREILQQDRQIQLIRKRLVKKVLSTVKTMLADEPEKYATFWSELGRAVKEGLLSDYDNRRGHPGDLLVPVDPRRRQADHPARLPRPDARGPGRDLLRHRRVPVGAGELAAHGGVPRQGLRGAAADRPGRRGLGRRGAGVRGQAAASRSPRARSTSAATTSTTTPSRASTALTTWMATTLAEDVKEVRLSHRLTTSAAVPGRRPRRPDPDAGEDVPGDGPGAAEGQADPGAQPQARAGHRAARPRTRRGRTIRGWPTPPSCSTAWRCWPRAASWPNPPRSWRCCPSGWRAACPEGCFRRGTMPLYTRNFTYPRFAVPEEPTQRV